MKVAFTTKGDDLAAAMDPRFGRAAKFLIYDLDADRFEIIVNDALDAPQGAGLKASETIIKAGAKALVSGDCGPKALAVLKAAGVKAYTCNAPTVAEALEACRAGSLTEIGA